MFSSLFLSPPATTCAPSVLIAEFNHRKAERMKIQCDVCDKAEASVYCTADEATLCDACDHRVHHANKLASKHPRFSLLHPSSAKHFPVCDVCQEGRAFLFCQQDRAILCRDCDVPIHSANEHTQKHNRFLLTGVKLSATTSVYSSGNASSNPTVSNTVNGGHCVPNLKPKTQAKRSVAASPAAPKPPPPAKSFSLAGQITANVNKGGGTWTINEMGGSTTSISEYLIEALPGWHFEEFIDSSSVPFGLCKADNALLPFVDADLKSTQIGSFSSERSGIWVPQASPSPHPLFHAQPMGLFNGLKETKEEANVKLNRGVWSDDGFTVPQISPPSSGSKRSRALW